MNVLFLTNIPSPYRVNFFNELGKLCDLTVLYERREALDREKNWMGEKAESFKEIFLKGKNRGNDSALSFSVIKYIKDKKFDVIVVGGYSTPTGMLAVEYLKLTGRKFILNTDGGMIKHDNKIKYMIKKHFISSADMWLSTGENTTKYLLNYGARKKDICKYKFTSLTNKDILEKIINPEKKQQLKKELGINEEKIILSVGRFIHSKGFDILIKSCQKIDKSVGVYIIGGIATDEYKQLTNKLKLENIHFLEFKSKDILKKYYKASDLFVLPTRSDVWGLVINEAMACGLPIITTNKCVAGLELIENGKQGYIIPVENEKVLSEKINKILDNDDLRTNMSLESLEKIKSYTIQNMAKEHINIFNNFLCGGI